jgi:hypothetical protein
MPENHLPSSSSRGDERLAAYRYLLGSVLLALLLLRFVFAP